jgi:nucleoside-diphosphate-sugar epimerase
MKVFVAGATGAIGRPLVVELVRQGHGVTGMTRSKASAQGMKELGAEVALVDALDAPAVEEAVRKSGAEAVIDELARELPKPVRPNDVIAALKEQAIGVMPNHLAIALYAPNDYVHPTS